MRMLVASCIVLSLLATIYGHVNGFKSYSQYQLWRLYATNSEQLERLRDVSRTAHQNNVTFWTERFHVDMPVSSSGTILSSSSTILD